MSRSGTLGCLEDLPMDVTVDRAASLGIQGLHELFDGGLDSMAKFCRTTSLRHSLSKLRAESRLLHTQHASTYRIAASLASQQHSNIRITATCKTVVNAPAPELGMKRSLVLDTAKPPLPHATSLTPTTTHDEKTVDWLFPTQTLNEPSAETPSGPS